MMGVFAKKVANATNQDFFRPESQLDIHSTPLPLSQPGNAQACQAPPKHIHSERRKEVTTFQMDSTSWEWGCINTGSTSKCLPERSEKQIHPSGYSWSQSFLDPSALALPHSALKSRVDCQQRKHNLRSQGITLTRWWVLTGPMPQSPGSPAKSCSSLYLLLPWAAHASQLSQPHPWHTQRSSPN